MCRRLTWVGIGLIGVLVIGCASHQAPRIERMVQSAVSASDHRAIAEYYRNDAAAARESGQEHRRLAGVYGALHNRNVAFASRAADHCNELAATEDERAAMFELLAVEHERLAQD